LSYSLIPVNIYVKISLELFHLLLVDGVGTLTTSGNIISLFTEEFENMNQTVPVVNFYDYLKDWPWKVWHRFYPIAKLAVFSLTLSICLLDPIDLFALACWGVVALLLQKFVAVAVMIVLGIIAVVVIWALELLLTWTIAVYVVPVIVWLVCLITKGNPADALFEHKLPDENPGTTT